jgi:hypothetical protein
MTESNEPVNMGLLKTMKNRGACPIDELMLRREA